MDEQPHEFESPHGIAEIINAKIYRDTEGHLRSRKGHRKLPPSTGQPRSAETRRKMAEGYARAKAEGRLGSQKKMRLRQEIRDHSIQQFANYRDEAILGLVEQMRDEKVSDAIRQKARQLIIEHTDGKPTQKVELDETKRIVYELGEFEPGAGDVVASGE